MVAVKRRWGFFFYVCCCCYSDHHHLIPPHLCPLDTPFAGSIICKYVLIRTVWPVEISTAWRWSIRQTTILMRYVLISGFKIVVHVRQSYCFCVHDDGNNVFCVNNTNNSNNDYDNNDDNNNSNNDNELPTSPTSNILFFNSLFFFFSVKN